MNKHTQGNDMADERPDDPQKPLESAQSPTPPQPNSGEEALRSKIYQISLTPINDIYYVPPGIDGSVGLSDKKLDAIMQAVKAELGVVLKKERYPMSYQGGGTKEYRDKIDNDNELRTFTRNQLKSELRNHFGIGSDV